MSSHLSTRDIERYRSKAITADEVRLLDSHLSECEECRRSFLDSESVDAAYGLVRRSLKSAAQPAEPHVAYEEMAAYVDGYLDAVKRDLVEAHLKTCADCESDLSELMRLQEAIASDEQSVAAVSQASALFWQSAAFRIGLEALAVLLIIAGVAWFSNRKIEAIRSENERLRKSVGESEAVIAELNKLIDSKASEPGITVKLKDGEGVVALDAKGELRGLEPLPEGYRQAVKKVLERERVWLPPVVAQLRGGSETTMSGNNDEPGFSLLSPVGIVVETNRPTFQWKRLSDAIEYEVSVSDASGEVIKRGKVPGIEWQPATPLARGQVYHWQVRAITNDGREVKSPPVGQPDAKFSVLDRNQFDEIQRARKAYPGSHLVLGTIYAKAGLVNEARSEFRALVDANPESQISRRILDSLRGLP
jgi:hypothetical protein